jgi:hypothetical protein
MYKLTPTTFDGTMLATDYEAKFLREHDPLCLVTEEPVEVEVAGAFPTSPRSQPQSLVLPLYVRMKNTTQAALNAFKTLFDPHKGDVLLTAVDGSDPPVTYRLTVKTINVRALPNSIDAFIVRLYVAKPIFESDELQSDEQIIDTSPTSWPVTNAGTVRALPVFEMSPLVLRPHTDGYTRRWQVICAWRSEFPASNYPLEIAGSANAGYIDYAAEVAAGRLRADWKDIRVLVDGVPTKFWAKAVAAQYLRLWIALDFKPAISAVLLQDITASSPVNGGELAVDDTSLWPENGFFKCSGGYECYQYTSKTPTALCGIVRGARNTDRWTGTAGDKLYLVAHEIEILTDYANEAISGAAPDAEAPIIELSSSTNEQHNVTGSYVAPGTDRSGQLLRAFYEDNLLSPLVSLDADNPPTSWFDFYDLPPSAARPQANSLELYVPCGVKAAANAITHDVVVNDLLGLEVFGTDIEGLETLLKRYCSTNDGNAVTLTPPAVLSRIRWSANLLPVTGCRTLDDDGEAIPANDDNFSWTRCQRFVLDQDTELSGLVVRLKKSADGSGEFAVYIVGETDGHPDFNKSACGAFVFASAGLSEGYFDIPLLFDESTALKRRPWLQAGAYYLIFVRSAPPRVGTIYISSSAVAAYVYPHGCMWKYDVALAKWIKTGRTARFAILGMPAAEKQSEAPTGSGQTVVAGNLKIVLDNATPRTPSIIRATQEHIYRLQGTLKNNDTDQELTLGIVPSLIAEMYDKSNAWNLFGAAAGVEKRSQGFKVGAAQTVPFIWAWLCKVGAPVDNVTLRIETDAGGKPSGTPIANGTATPVAGASLTTTGDWIQFVFATPPSLVAGTQYHIAIARSGAVDAAKYYRWRGLAVGDYPFGAGYYWDGDSWETSGEDHDFRIGLIPTIAIDCMAHTVIRSDTGENVPGLLTPSDEAEWMRLDAGEVDLSYIEAGIGVVRVKTLWRHPWA